MAWADLKAAVAAVIRTNGNQEITGALLQSTLNSIIDQVGANSTFKGVATPSTNPGTPDGPIFYLAAEKGVYSNFGGLTIPGNTVRILNWTNGSWSSLETNITNYNQTLTILKSHISELIRLHIPQLNFIGLADTTTTGVASNNNAYLISESGTIFGVAGCLQGQLIYYAGSRWVVEWPTNRSNKYDLLSIVRNIFSELKNSPVATAYSTHISTNTPTSAFNGWRFKCNFLAPFRVAEFAIASSAANKKVIGYVWDENGKIVSTASILTKQSGSGVYPVYFVFDKDITSDLVGTKFWIGYRAEDYSTIIMDGIQNGGSEGGLLDLTVFEQYSATTGGNYDSWSNVTILGSRKPYLKLYDSTTQNLVTLISTTVNSQISSMGLTGIGSLFTDRVEYDTYTSQLSGTTQSGGNVYGDPFTGWGVLFNKVGISFNAIKIPAIRRNTVVEARKWKSIQLVVKNSPTSPTILALSPKIPLDPESSVITNIILPLMDSSLQTFVTLNDSSFSGSTYFIGFCFYAADGSYAFGGPVTGSQSNYAGTSYYIANASFTPSVPTSWSGYSGNPCIPMEHALLDGTEIVKHLLELDDIDVRITSLENQIGSSTIDISLPDKIYATVGDRLQLFYRGMIKAPNSYIYDILVSCSKGNQYPRYFEYLPVSGDVGTTTFKVEVKNKDGLVLGTKTCSLITKAVVQSPSTTKKVLCVGDSLTSAGLWCIEASRRLVGSGGTPAGLALSNIAFTGRKTGSGIGWEGTGGWTWTSYATAGTPAYKFFLSGVTTAPGIGSTYTNNGITYTVSEVNITGGTGYISATGSGAPTASGTLTKASGTGDSTLTFSSYTADSGNPFWEADTNSLDFPQYVNTYMGGACDVIYFLLTWNGQTPWRTDFASMIATAKTLIDHIHTHYPNCKMKIMGMQVPSLNGGMGANYGATGTSYADTYGNVVTVLNMNKAYQDWCNEAAYSYFLEFVNVSAQFDSENNMPETDKAVNTRSAKTEKIGTNGVHPSTEGYYQIGDVVFRNFIANFCQ